MKISVYCGESIEDKCRQQLHPLNEVKRAKEIIELAKDGMICYSNHLDFVSAIKYIGDKQGVDVEFFLNGVSCGNDIDPIFGDFNRALTMINKLGV